MRYVLLLAILTLIHPGCAQLGGPDGGSDNLPNRGVTGYEPVAQGSPPSSRVLTPEAGSGLRFHQPHVERSGDGVVMFFGVHSANHSWIARSHSLDGLTFDSPQPVLGDPADTRAYESPSVACRSEQCILVTASPTQDRLYLARGSLSGPFILDDAPLMTITEDYEAGGITHPSVAYDPDRDEYLLVYQVKTSADAPPELVLATMTEDGTVQKRGPLVIVAQPCTSSMGDPEPCWDADGRSSPELKRATLHTGRSIWRLSYTGTSPEDSAIGFAASWDADGFTAFESNPGFSGQRDEVAHIAHQDRYLLYFVSSSAWGAAGISAAVTSSGFPSDQF
ncbi:MAG: hypothetical protein VX834_08665 [Myxococcota bacterium]|nr:hypothetical protein [Myxococcota bacterium]